MNEKTGWQITWPGYETTASHFRKAGRLLFIFAARRRQRRILAALEDYELLDIDLSRAQARREAEKPSWRR